MSLLSNSVKKLEGKIDQTSSYIDVYRENIERRNSNKLDSLKRRHHKLLLPYEINTKLDEYFTHLKEVELEKLKDKYYWQLRKLHNKKAEKETIAKKLEEYDQKTADIEVTYDEEGLLDFIVERSEMYLKTIVDHEEPKEFMFKDLSVEDVAKYNTEHLRLYEMLKDELTIEYNELKDSLEQKLEEKTKVQKEKSLIQLEKLNEKLEVKKNQINEYNEIRKNEISEAMKNASEEDMPIYQAILNLYEEDNDDHLVVRNLLMQFGGLKAVNDLSFTVKRGEIYGLIGPNGAGKTTAFNCITQFYKPTAGYIYFKNRKNEVFNLVDIKVHDIIRYGIVRTFQNVELIWELSILDNLLVGAHTAYRTNFFEQLVHWPTLKKEEEIIRAKANQILEDLGLSEIKNQVPMGLPYGTLKRIELARTLMLNPELIILDEPAAGLNDTETVELAETIKRIRDEYEVTIFLVEHDMGLVMEVCDRICAISFGKLLAIGTPEEIQSNPLVQEAYLGGE